MSTRHIEIVFWAGEYADLSSADLGTQVQTEAEAFDELYTRIASEQNPVNYLNEIYDNAQVEFQEDNMESLTVRDFYDIQIVYGDMKPTGFEQGVQSLTIYPANSDDIAVGMMYVAKAEEAGEASFNEYLEELKQRVLEK